MSSNSVVAFVVTSKSAPILDPHQWPCTSVGRLPASEPTLQRDSSVRHTVRTTGPLLAQRWPNVVRRQDRRLAAARGIVQQAAALGERRYYLHIGSTAGIAPTA